MNEVHTVAAEHFARHWAKVYGYALIPKTQIGERKARLSAVFKDGERIGYIITQGKHRDELPLARAPGVKVRKVIAWHLGGLSEEERQPQEDPTRVRLESQP